MSDGNIEKRMYNVEVALIGLFTLIEDTLPPVYADDVNRMMSDFFDATKQLGGFNEKHADRLNGIFKITEAPHGHSE